MKAVAFALVLLVPLAAKAAPPESGADPSLAEYFRSLRHPRSKNGCCDLSDCRQVQYRIHSDARGTRYQAYIKRTPDGQPETLHDFRKGTNQWEDVPEEVVLRRRENPTGEGIACWQHDYYLNGILNPRFLCFVPAEGT
jgi:hypothetical protein